jgi:hypothetical protein
MELLNTKINIFIQQLPINYSRRLTGKEAQLETLKHNFKHWNLQSN